MANAKMDTWLLVGVFALIGLLAYQQGALTVFGIAPSPEDKAASPTVVEVKGATGNPTTLTAVIEKRYSQSTSMATENVTIVVNGAEKSTKLDSQSETVSSGNTVELYYGLESGTYYTSYAKGVIPDVPSLETSDPAFQPADAYKLYQMDAASSAMWTVVNADGTSTNPGTAPSIGSTFHVFLECSVESADQSVLLGFLVLTGNALPSRDTLTGFSLS